MNDKDYKNWKDHVQRVPNNRSAKVEFHYILRRRKNIGRIEKTLESGQTKKSTIEVDDNEFDPHFSS